MLRKIIGHVCDDSVTPEQKAAIKVVIEEELSELDSLSNINTKLYAHSRIREILLLGPSNISAEEIRRKNILNILEEKKRDLADVEQLESNSNAECPKCHAKNTICYEFQTRSGDEAITLIRGCPHCGNKWREF